MPPYLHSFSATITFSGICLHSLCGPRTIVTFGKAKMILEITFGKVKDAGKSLDRIREVDDCLHVLTAGCRAPRFCHSFSLSLPE